jgi:prepilin-type N-terminal cleavage/methylation domain-containing protein
MRPKTRPVGFTLIELMIVVAILSILALIILPKFGQLVRKSSESATRGHMGAMRSALSIYYSSLEGMYPSDLSPFFNPGTGHSLDASPQVYTAIHGTTILVDSYPVPDPLADTGRWGYVSGEGKFLVVCTHTDLATKVWSQQ